MLRRVKIKVMVDLFMKILMKYSLHGGTFCMLYVKYVWVFTMHKFHTSSIYSISNLHDSTCLNYWCKIFSKGLKTWKNSWVWERSWWYGISTHLPPARWATWLLWWPPAISFCIIWYLCIAFLEIKVQLLLLLPTRCHVDNEKPVIENKNKMTCPWSNSPYASLELDHHC